MTTRKKQKGTAEVGSEKTRDLLLHAAKVLFSQKGYDGTSVKDLADMANVNISLVSYHFGGKEELYRACFAVVGKERLATAQRVLQKPSSVDEFKIRLRMMLEEMVTRHFDEPEVSKLIHRECEMDQPIMQDIFRETFLKVFETLVEFFCAAQKKGFFKDGVDPLIATSMLFGSLFHFTKMDHICERYFDRTLKDQKYRTKVIDQILAIFLEGVLK